MQCPCCGVFMDKDMLGILEKRERHRHCGKGYY
jgi:hypothetical protein